MANQCLSLKKKYLYKECIMAKHTKKKMTKGYAKGGAKVKKMMGGGSKMTKGYARGGAKVGRKK